MLKLVHSDLLNQASHFVWVDSIQWWEQWREWTCTRPNRLAWSRPSWPWRAPSSSVPCLEQSTPDSESLSAWSTGSFSSWCREAGKLLPAVWDWVCLQGTLEESVMFFQQVKCLPVVLVSTYWLSILFRGVLETLCQIAYVQSHYSILRVIQWTINFCFCFFRIALYIVAWSVSRIRRRSCRARGWRRTTCRDNSKQRPRTWASGCRPPAAPWSLSSISIWIMSNKFICKLQKTNQ